MFIFECKKIIKRSKLWKLLIILIFIMFFTQLFLYCSQQKQLDFLYHRLEDKRGIIEKTHLNSQKGEFFVNDMLKSLSSKNDLSLTQYYLKSVSPRKSTLEEFPIQYNIDKLPGPSVIKTGEWDDTYEELKIVVSKKISPLTPPTILTNPDTSVNFNGSNQEKLSFFKYNKRYYIQSWYSVWNFFINNGALVVFLIVIFFFGSLFASELDEKNKTVNFLLARKSKFLIFINKVLATNFLSLTFLSLFFSVMLVINGVVFKFGSLKYPVHQWIYGAAGQTAFNPLIFNRSFFSPYKTSFMTLESYLLKSFILLFLGIIFVNSITFLISIITRNEIVTVLLSFFIILCAPFLPIIRYSPLLYLNIDKVVSNYIGMKTNVMSSYDYALVILTSSSLLLLCISYGIFKIREKGK